MPTTSTHFANDIINNLNLTQVEQYELLAIETQQQLCELLGWTEDYYAAFMYGTAINFLTWKTNSDAAFVEKFERSKLFWNWFKNMWANENGVLIPHLHTIKSKHRYWYFSAFWDTEEMAQKVIIPRVVMADILNTFKSNV